MDLEQRKQYVADQLRAELVKFVDHKITPQVLKNVMEAAKKVLENSKAIDDINDHIETVVKTDELDPRMIRVTFTPKDSIGEDFLRGVKW